MANTNPKKWISDSLARQSQEQKPYGLTHKTLIVVKINIYAIFHIFFSFFLYSIY